MLYVFVHAFLCILLDIIEEAANVSLVFSNFFGACAIHRYLLFSNVLWFSRVNADSYQSAASGVPTDNDPNNTTVGYIYMLLLYMCCALPIGNVPKGSFLTNF